MKHITKADPIMKSVKLIFAIITIGLITQSFKTTLPNFIGTFGVAENNPSRIKLTIKENGNFSFQDFSNPKNKTRVSGTWKLKNKNIILVSDSKKAFHHKWKVNSEGTKAKSRMGLSFYSLCKIKTQR